MGNNKNIAGLVMSEDQFAAFLKGNDDGAGISMVNCLVEGKESKRLVRAGRTLDNLVLNVAATTFSGNAFGMLTIKTGDNCRINYENIAVLGDEINTKYKPQYTADHQYINIVSSKLSIVALSVLLANMGDHSTLHIHNCLITEEGIKALHPIKMRGDNIVVDIKVSRVPQATIGLIHQKFGNNCVLDA